MEHFINILIIDKDSESKSQLKEILLGKGNNLIFCDSLLEAQPILLKREVGIILINIKGKGKKEELHKLLDALNSNPRSVGTRKILITERNQSKRRLIHGLKRGATDFIFTPYNRELLDAKIEVFKNDYFKSRRINQLLQNIFPENVLKELNKKGKFSPKKIKNGVVLFADFVAFTKLSKNIKPIVLLDNLKVYFTKFDEIMERYQLEKVKTIGDAYMALAGVTEGSHQPAVRATLAAIEIRNFVLEQKKLAQHTGDISWDIRIGIHSGPLVAGVVGGKKISFDVWGDTVNIASRAEQNSERNSITVTAAMISPLEEYFNVVHRGEINIKYGDFVDMYFVNAIKLKYSLFNEGNLPNRQLRKICHLPPMDFECMRRDIYNKLETSLPRKLDYHNIKHFINVEKAAIRLAQLEGVEGEDLSLLLTAVWFHDAGYIVQRKGHEDVGIKMAKEILPRFGYSEDQIKVIVGIIDKTRYKGCPETLLEQIMCDADLDYLGRADYTGVSKTLRNELANYGEVMTDLEWIDFQLEYLENVHRYHTITAVNIREKSKKRRIHELKKMKDKIINKTENKN